MANCAAVLLIVMATPTSAAVNHPAKVAKAPIDKALAQHKIEHEYQKLVTLPMFINKHYSNDCWKKKQPITMTQLAAKVFKLNQTLPGAGIKPEDQKGYGTVMKDGFYEVACIKDYMYHHGDAAGGNKHEYEIGSSSGVSIVHYSMMVPKEDQQAMTAEVCFEFCRTVPDMLFFGLTAGRECYCEPFFKPMAGGSSQCDAVCEGEPTTMCGGMAKSSIYQMHFCDSTADDLASAADKIGDFLSKGKYFNDLALDGESLQSAADQGQAAFGSAGDTVMSDLMQTAKVFAGDLEKASNAGIKVVEQLEALDGEAKALDGADFTDPAEMKKAEEVMKKMEATLAEAEATKTKAMDLHELVAGMEFEEDTEFKKVEGEPVKQYHPIMYFVDREYEEMPSTCGGDTLKKPILAKDVQQCAAACGAEGIACAGFSYVELKSADDKVCFLFSKFKSVTYYTECKSFLQTPVSFLQQPQAAHAVIQKSNSTQTSEKEFKYEGTMCYAKFASFTGTTLKPDPSGKCELCLKTADKAQRCFE